MLATTTCKAVWADGLPGPCTTEPLVVDAYEWIGRESPSIESRRGNRQAKRVPDNRTEVAAGTWQPASRVATPRQFRQLNFRLESETRGRFLGSSADLWEALIGEMKRRCTRQPADRARGQILEDCFVPRGQNRAMHGGAGRNRTADEGFADPCLPTWLPRQRSIRPATNFV